MFKKGNKLWDHPNSRKTQFKKGHISHNKGKTKDNYKPLKIGGEKISAENNYNWKGDNVGMKALHEWIKNHKPKPKFCENCRVKLPYDLANISGKYKRDINDFEWLCRSCHMNKDGRLKYFKKFVGRNKPLPSLI